MAASRGSGRIPPPGGLWRLTSAPNNQELGPRIYARRRWQTLTLTLGTRGRAPQAGSTTKAKVWRRDSVWHVAEAERGLVWREAEGEDEVREEGSGGGRRSSALWASHYSPKTGKAPGGDGASDSILCAQHGRSASPVGPSVLTGPRQKAGALLNPKIQRRKQAQRG